MPKKVENDQFELERLKAEYAQEKQMRESLEESVRELRITCDELEKRGDGEEDESDQWKTRYETQREMNALLQTQAILLQDQVEDAKKAFRESKMPKPMREIGNNNEVNEAYVAKLESEKRALEQHYRDLECKLDQEAKAFHKANEQRKNCLGEISNAKGEILQSSKRASKAEALLAALNSEEGLKSKPAATLNMNIPQDQRIIDTKYGPIRKTAAVKTLPKLHENET